MLERIKNTQNPEAYVVLSGQKISFHELYFLALKMGSWLSENNVTCLAFCVPNGLTNLLAYLGGFASDVQVMPLNPRLISAELTKIIRQYQPSHIWVAREKIDENLKNTCKELGLSLFEVSPNLLQEPQPLGQAIVVQPPLSAPVNTPNQAIIQFTSGTLGEYKGAVHSYQKCAVYAGLMAKDMRYRLDDRLLICLSLNHAMAFSYQLLPALYLGLDCVILPGFETEAVLSAIETYNITSISVLPTMAYLLAKSVLESHKKYPSLNKIIIAGDALPLAMRKDIVAAFDCEPIIGIGMTECFGYCLNFNPQQKPGASGLPVAGFSFKVVDNDYRDLPVGEIGEILIKGAGLFTEYYELPELTEASFHQGFLKTGDLGLIDSDGYLWFRGRRKHLIISGGSNIAPLEIEAAMYEHPDILEAVVVGAPDPVLIEKGVAFVATAANSTLTVSAMKAFLTTKLSEYKLPKKIYLLDSLPKNATGKLDRAILAERAKQYQANKKLSVIIIAKNEAANIRRCLESVRWADEIIVLDSGSDDGTMAIASEFTDKVFSTDWQGYGVQKQRALGHATGDWVLNLDADESVGEDLKYAIMHAIEKPYIEGYRIPIRMFFYGKLLRFSSSPKRHIRLFKREGACYSDDIVHEKIVLPKGARVGKLREAILHHSFQDISHVLYKINRYSSYSAKIRLKEKRHASFLKTMLGTTWMFLRCYFLQGGFIDGKEGFLFALLNAQGTFYRGIKQIYIDNPSRGACDIRY